MLQPGAQLRHGVDHVFAVVQDEEAGLVGEVAGRSRASAVDVLRGILAGEEPFATEGFARLSR
jgi:hypothetical protein